MFYACTSITFIIASMNHCALIESSALESNMASIISLKIVNVAYINSDIRSSAVKSYTIALAVANWWRLSELEKMHAFSIGYFHSTSDFYQARGTGRCTML